MEKLKKVVLALIECFSAILEIETPTLEFVKPETAKQQNITATYIHDHQILLINENYPFEFEELVGTVAHEIYHKWQYDNNKYDFSKIKNASSSSLNVYMMQRFEQEAYAFQAYVLQSLFKQNMVFDSEELEPGIILSIDILKRSFLKNEELNKKLEILKEVLSIETTSKSPDKIC